MNRYPHDYGSAYDGMRYRRHGRFYDFRHARNPGDFGRYDAGFATRYGRGEGRYGGDFERGWGPRFGVRYDEEYRFRTRGHPQGKSSWQTNYGDPFDDRQRRTPMRIMRSPRGREPYDLPQIPYGQDYEAWGARQPYWRVDPRTGYLLD